MHEIYTYEQVTPVPKSQHTQKIEPAPAVPQAEATKQPLNAASAVSPPKVDYATDLFNMLTMDAPIANGSGEAAPDDNSWAGFQCTSLFTYWIIKVVLLILWTFFFAIALRLKVMVVILSYG